MAMKNLPLFLETGTVTGRYSTRHMGIYCKCKPIKRIEYIKSKRIEDDRL